MNRLVAGVKESASPNTGGRDPEFDRRVDGDQSTIMTGVNRLDQS